MSKQYVHFTEDETICEYCHDLKKLQNPLSLSDLEEKKKLEEHLKRWQHQGLFFKQRKQEMVKNKNSNWIVIVQDFTQIQVQNTFFQDLIICLYFLDAKEKDGMGKKVFTLRCPNINYKK